MIADLVTRIAFAMIIFVPLEHLLPRNKDQKHERRLWTMDAVYALLGGVIIILGTTIFITLGVMLTMPIVPESVSEFSKGLQIIVQVALIMILADLGYYAIHRALHTFPFLWKFHAIHHSIEEMDWLAAHRVHPFDQILTRGGSLIIPFALGFSATAFGIWSVIFSWHSLLKHSNVKVNFGPLRWVFVSPVFHHWHHANQVEAHDHNFAGQLSFIDQLFGTAIMTEKESPAVYGVDDPLPENFVDQMFAPLRS